MLPRVLGVLLMFAGAGYLIDGFARTLLTRYSEYETTFGLIVFASSPHRRTVIRPLVVDEGDTRDQSSGVIPGTPSIIV
jgi:hypothetical protein